MGILDDMKNPEPVSYKVFTNKDFIKVVDEIFKDVEKELKILKTLGFNINDVVKYYKQTEVGKFELNKIKIGNMVITFSKTNNNANDGMNVSTNEINKDNESVRTNSKN